MFKVRYKGSPRVQEVPLDGQTLSPALAAEVDKVWSEAQEEQGNGLSNGSIFSVTDIVGSLVRGRFVEYKHFVAVRRRPDLFAALQVRPLAVTGLSRCDGGIILGCRSDRVTQDQGLWEFVPSGGVDRSSRRADGFIDVARQIERELREETGLDPSLIANVSLRYVIEDSSSHVFDIVADVALQVSAERAMSALNQASQDEYESFKVLDADGRRLFFERSQERLAPLSRYIAEDLEFPAAV